MTLSKLVLATNNPKKVEEIKTILHDKMECLSMQDLGFDEDLPETKSTIEGNSLQKAEALFSKLNLDCLADDTGLEVFTLNGEPGVRSARYAGEEKDPESNMNLLLQKLDGHANREAQFKTVLTLFLKGEYYQFTGICKGLITTEKRGVHGFGYDPIFQPDGYSVTMAEMSPSEKNNVSHRALALAKLNEFLSNFH